MAEAFVGKWELETSENFDEYMKYVGVGLVTRTMAGKLKPVIEITVTGNHWKIVQSSTVKTIVTEFDLGVEFDEETPDGRKMKSTFTFEDGKLIQDQKPIGSKDKHSTIVRYIEGDKYVNEIQSDAVKAKRVYKRA